MLYFDKLRRGALGAAVAFALAMADGCPTTTTLDFDEMEENAVLDTQWDALGFHFVPGPLFGDLPAGSLPRAITPPNVPAPAGKALMIHPFRFSEPYQPSLMWCRLDYPAKRVQVTVGNTAGAPLPVRLLVTDANGAVTSIEKSVPPGGAVGTVLQVTMESARITAFAVHAPRGVILVDNLIVEDIR